jgi:CheY-like chemotaxis protein
VVGPVASIGRALEVIEAEPDLDAVLLDFNLGGLPAYPVADKLCARNIPFMFTSGYDERLFRDRYPQVKNLRKPYALPDLEKSLMDMVSRQPRQLENAHGAHHS